jgi:hypothetical protein
MWIREAYNQLDKFILVVQKVLLNIILAWKWEKLKNSTSLGALRIEWEIMKQGIKEIKM